MAKQKRKIYKESSLEEITVKKVICEWVCGRIKCEVTSVSKIVCESKPDDSNRRPRPVRGAAKYNQRRTKLTNNPFICCLAFYLHRS